MRHSIGNTKHIWDNGNIVGDISGSTYKQYFRALNLIYSLIGTTKQYYRFNGHGDVVALTNATGTVTKTYTYNAFGEEQNINATDANPFRYCGEYFDKVSGTLYLRARNYNASIGRFTQEDPIRHSGNWYAYCGSNPINLIDPTGLFDWGKLFQGVVAFAVGAAAVAASVLTFGAATPLAAVALVGIACAGTASMVFGAYDIQEAETGENKLKDEINDTFGNNAYDFFEVMSVGISTMGIGWIASNPYLFNEPQNVSIDGEYSGASNSANYNTQNIQQTYEEKLISQLNEKGVKFCQDKIVFITKDVYGNIMWLEEGNSDAGLIHIIQEHKMDLGNRGISDIVAFLKEYVSTQQYKIGYGINGPYGDFVFNGHTIRMAFGDNGFIVSCYPVD